MVISMSSDKKERFFNVRIAMSGDPDEPFDPVPLLERHVLDIKRNHFPFYEHEGEDAFITNTTSWL